jgi:hypothetical protein
MTEFIIKSSSDITKGVFKEKKNAFEFYKDLCEFYPEEQFKIIKKQVIEETIAESNDYRQKSFDFIL